MPMKNNYCNRLLTTCLFIWYCWIRKSAATAFFLQPSYRPVVLWHGLGDSYDSVGMLRIKELIEQEFPGIFVHSIYLDSDTTKDQDMSLIGNLTEYQELVCEQLSELEILAKDGFDAIGFSQGGLFLRAYAETCVGGPQLKTLITYGSPHNGVSDLPPCKPTDFVCKQRNNLLLKQVWSSYAQGHVVPAQYFRDPEHLEDYLEHSSFLADINNERRTNNVLYKQSLSGLERLVLIMFSEDETVIPKESSWFQEVNRTTGLVTPLEHRALYKDDWLGLKRLGENDLIDYLTVEGVHMQIPESQLLETIQTYLGATVSPVTQDVTQDIDNIVFEGYF